MRRFIVRLLIVAITVSLGSCSSSPREPETEVHFTDIALVSPREVIDASQPQSRGSRAQEGAGKGMVTGTAGGALAGAIACGPFLYGLCVLALAGAAGIAGTATGAMYGFTGIGKDDARKLERELESISRERDLQSALVKHIREQVPAEMLAEPESAEIQAVLTIENVEFVKEQGKIHLISTTRVTFESTESRRVPAHGSRVFKGISDKYKLDKLLDHESGDLESAMRESLLDVSSKIVKILNERWRPGMT